MAWFDRIGRWLAPELYMERRGVVFAGAHPRDPVIAALWGLSADTDAGIAVTVDNAMQVPAVASSVRLLSETVATIPLDLFEVMGDGNSRRATEQPLHALVHDAPVEWLSSTDWRRRLMHGLLLDGNQYNRIRWDGIGGIKAIEPLPRSVTPKMIAFDGAQRVNYIVFQGGKQEVLASIDCMHFRGPFQSGDLVRAASPIDIGRELIARNWAAGAYISRFFANSAVPKAALEIPGNLGNEATKKLRDDFERRHKGIENAHKLVIVPGGMKLSPLASTNEESQTLELYKQTSLEIASRLYGIPPHLSGDTEKVSSWGTGIEQMDIGYVKHVVRPYLEGIEQTLSMALLSPSGRRKFKFEFNVEGLLRGDFKSRMEGYALMIQWGMTTVNEIRRLENLAPIAGGDVRMFPLNYAPADQIMAVLLRESPAEAKRAFDALLADMRAPANGGNGHV